MAIAGSETLRAIITVEDRTAAALHAINQRFAAFGAPLRRIGSGLKEIGEEAGLARLGEHAKGAFEHLHRLHEAVTDILAPLGALSALVSFSGIAEVVKSTAEYGEHLQLASRATGLTTTQLGGIEYAARLANVDPTQADQGLEYLNRNIAMAAMGKNKDLEIILGRMGISNVPGHMVAPQAAMAKIADEAKQLVDSGQTQLANAMMAAAFGARRGAALLPLFAQGSEHLAELSAEAAAHGQAMTPAQAAAAAKFEESYKQMGSAVQGLGYAIGNELFPTLTPVIADMTAWVDANRAWIATNIGGAVRDLAAWLRGVDWAGVGGGIKTMATDAAWLVNRIGGVGPALAIIAGIRFAPAILAFGQLGLAIAATAARMVLFPVAALIASIATLIPTITSLSDVWAALDLIMDANPIGLIVLGLAALAAAGYEVYEHWDQIEILMSNVFTAIAGYAEMTRDKIELVMSNAFTLVAGYAEAARDKIELVMSNAFTLIAGYAEAARDRIVAAFGAARDWIEARFKALEGWVEGVWKGIGIGWDNMWTGIKNTVDATLDWIEARIRRFGDWFKGFLPSLPSWLGGPAALEGSGAAAGGGGGPLGPAGAAGPLPADRAALARELYQHATAAVDQGGLGLDRADALAMLGNAEAESGLNPAAIGDHGTSAGLFQWHADRMARMQATLGADWQDPVKQFDYAWREQMNRDRGWFGAAGSAKDRTNSWEQSFEKPANPADRSNFTSRIADALATPIGRTTPPPPASKMQGRIDVTVSHHNPPPGATAQVAARGDRDLDLNLGQAFVY